MAENTFGDDREAVLAALGEDFQTPAAADDSADSAVRGAEEGAAILLARFVAAAEENAATVQILGDESEIAGAAAAYLRQNQLPSRAAVDSEWARLDWRGAGVAADCRPPEDGDHCGITGVVAAAADCGAMLLRGDIPHRLLASLLPPHHLAILRTENILPDVAALFSAAKTPAADSPLPSDGGEEGENISPLPRGLALFCGPSRTADIEQTLTLGAHGPAATHVMIINKTGENA